MSVRSGFAAFAFVLCASAAQADERDTAIRGRVDALSTHRSVEGVPGLLEHARRALVQAEEARGQEDRRAAERAVQIAEAAVAAAERRIEARRATGGREAARRMLEGARARLTAAEEALGNARRATVSQ